MQILLQKMFSVKKYNFLLHCYNLLFFSINTDFLNSLKCQNMSHFIIYICVFSSSIQVLYPVIPVRHGGTTYYYYPTVVYLPVYYFVPVLFTYQDAIVFEEPCVQVNLNESTGVRCNYACDDQQEEHG